MLTYILHPPSIYLLNSTLSNSNSSKVGGGIITGQTSLKIRASIDLVLAVSIANFLR